MNFHRLSGLGLSICALFAASTASALDFDGGLIGGGTWASQVAVQTSTTTDQNGNSTSATTSNLQDTDFRQGYLLGGRFLVSDVLATPVFTFRWGLLLEASYLHRGMTGDAGELMSWNAEMFPIQLYMRAGFFSWNVGMYYSKILNDSVIVSGASKTVAGAGLRPEDTGLLGGVGLNFGELSVDVRLGTGFRNVRTSTPEKHAFFADALVGYWF